MAVDIYAETTNKIIALLEQGTVPWVRPWDEDKCTGPAGPMNAVTGAPYHGINVLLLGMHPAAFVTGDPRFCTYKQAQDKGWQVRKGEKSTPIVFYKPLEVDNDKHNPADENSPATRLIGLLRTFAVFHASQIDGLPPYEAPTVEECPWQRPDAAAIILKNSGAVLTTGGDRAFYSPFTDHINLPPDTAFAGPHEWASVAMHEAGHWTGHPLRLNRDQTGNKGSALYASEELRAELASVFIGSILNIPCPLENHASYIGHWLERLKNDSREIFRASADAQRITDMLMGFHPDYKPDAHPSVAEALPRPVPAPEALTI